MFKYNQKAPKIGGIYQILNLKTNKIYLGSAQSFRRRWKDHINYLMLKKHSSPLLQKSFDKHGKDNFIFQIIEIIKFPTRKNLLSREQYFLDKIQPFEENGYNICKIAGSTLGIKKPQISEIQRGSKSHRAKLNENQVLEIKEKIIHGETLKDLGKEYGIKAGTISDIKNEKIWKHVKVQKNIKNLNLHKHEGTKNPMVKLTEIQVKEIKNRILNGEKNIDLAKEFNLTPGEICHIKKGRSWKNIL
jgi:group I intron endonuclease